MDNGTGETADGTPEPSGAGFEKSLTRLEAIVAEMESGRLPLETMMARFEEGQRLVRYCGDKLGEVERKIELLVKQGETVTTRPFDPSDAGSEEKG
ncbi:MAG: exodeoxyribonuclease VII small subunit [bacterium]